MADVFLIFGYGTPRNIFADPNYRVYLSMVFNTIFDIAQKQKTETYVVFCGGNTDFFEPYNRTEADEMKKYFKYLLERPFLKNYSRKFHLLTENRSLSTLENMLFSRKIIQKCINNPENIFIFCERTRQRRVKIISKKIFKGPLKVFPVDFDMNEHRYLDPSFIQKKEDSEINNSLWALKNLKNLRKHHKVFEEKFKLLRHTAPKDRSNVLKEFWEEFSNIQNNT